MKSHSSCKTQQIKKKKLLLTTPYYIARAIVRSLEIIGEAATKVSDEFKAAYPYIEWKKMAGTRNRLIHDYFGVDYDIVWNIIQTPKLPDLQENISDILNNPR